MPHSDPTLPLEVIEEARISPATDRAIRQLLCECFPADAETYARRRAWHDSVPAYAVVSGRGDLMLGHLGIVVRTVACAGLPTTVAGVQSFCVAPPYRGAGLSKRLMIRALEEALRRGVRFGLLFCVPELERMYRGLGWQRIAQLVTMLNERGELVPMSAKNICMSIDLCDGRFPRGPLDLQGRDW